MPDVQEEPEGPRLRLTDQPNRAERKRSWRQDALFELEELAELYDVDATAVRL
ncbi:hypothetical protein ACFWAN_32570 [Streptomyces mirabilis]|uniref:hypothetical protein n=1 Tax=Streptomyces mirabilis TaxID=68239 RepID=UPI0036573C37